ncbi:MULTISPECIES: hypothetical protein [unclassified Streptomyces]|uniref:hypothetical protein n=1 Tax=unclassified Streptomyces TaxID=2593676 RepID=UPI001CD62E87|nr:MULTISPECIES: hypothetical protein [unclassified Streptomyces]
MDEPQGDLAGGWVAVTGGLITGLGTAADPPPPARRSSTSTASGRLWTGPVVAHQSRAAISFSTSASVNP